MRNKKTNLFRVIDNYTHKTIADHVTKEVAQKLQKNRSVTLKEVWLKDGYYVYKEVVCR